MRLKHKGSYSPTPFVLCALLILVIIGGTVKHGNKKDALQAIEDLRNTTYDLTYYLDEEKKDTFISSDLNKEIRGILLDYTKDTLGGESLKSKQYKEYSTKANELTTKVIDYYGEFVTK